MKFKVNYVFEFKTKISRKVHNFGTIRFVCLFGVYSQITYLKAFTNKSVTVRFPVKYVFKLRKMTEGKSNSYNDWFFLIRLDWGLRTL